MTARLQVIAAHGRLTVQDTGRQGYLPFGVSRGGAADPLALAEGAALLGHKGDCAALEMAGAGGVFEVTEPTRIALTGAPMRASCDGTPLAWNASHQLYAGQRLEIGGASAGVYGYLHLGGGIDTPLVLGSRSVHLTAGLGSALKAGDSVPLAVDPGGPVGHTIPVEDRFTGGTLRVVRSAQTALFTDSQLEAFTSTAFRRAHEANRMGVRVDGDAGALQVAGGLTVVSEIISPGDIQMTGAGLPFVLMYECQTTGGYPRIATVIPADMPRAAQAPAGASLRFQFVDTDTAVDAERRFRAQIKALPGLTEPLVRDPAGIADLLSYQLVSGVTAGDEDIN